MKRGLVGMPVEDISLPSGGKKVRGECEVRPVREDLIGV